MTTNYPDILGEITGGNRVNVNVLQVATALRPLIARAGRPFEMIMLLQNACDVPLEVTVTLHLPEKDNVGKKKRFMTKAQRLVVTLIEAGVGVIVLPVSTMPDIAIGDDYKIGMEIKTQPASKGKPTRIRLPDGGGEVDFELMDDERQSLIADLKKLHWTAEHATLRNNVLESTCTIMSGKAGSFADLQPSWTPLWDLSDHADDRLMFIRHRDAIESKLLPALSSRRNIFVNTQEKTEAYFKDSGYRLTGLEINFITRLLTYILESAVITERDPRYLAIEDLNIRRYLAEDYLDNPQNPVFVPFWVQSFLKAMTVRPEIVDSPMKAIMYFSYEELLKDAMMHTFIRLETALGIEVGTPEERLGYIQTFMEVIEAKTLDLNTLFMPLIFGGMIIGDSVLLKDERPTDVIDMLRKMVDMRLAEQDETTQETFNIARRLFEMLNNRYSGRNWN